ncbi:hypothetical protein FRC03_001257 [Tulasnella sp. 419]|nr:hypothetical protein FRC03_001257 [Tulasnella sp. 419]
MVDETPLEVTEGRREEAEELDGPVELLVAIELDDDSELLVIAGTDVETDEEEPRLVTEEV